MTTETLWLLELRAEEVGHPSKFWTGVRWDDSALEAARYVCETTAEQVRISVFGVSPALFNRVEVKPHTFSCG